MSEDDKQPPKPPKPMKKTSAVPLKKETVRVTLKANPDADKQKGTPPKAEEGPTATKPGDSPPAPAPTIPLKSAPKPSGAPAPKPAAPAPTVQLKSPGGTTAPKTTPLKTQPVSTPGPSGEQGQGTQALPKATVQLGSATQALGAPTALAGSQAATLQTAVEEDDEENDTVTGILSIVAFVLALGVLSLQLMTTMKWTAEEDPVNGEGLNQLFE